MNIATLFAYLAAVSFIFYLLHHLYQTLVKKKEVYPSVGNLIYVHITLIIFLWYGISKEDWPLVIFYGTMILWGILGLTDKLSIKKKK